MDKINAFVEEFNKEWNEIHKERDENLKNRKLVSGKGNSALVDFINIITQEEKQIDKNIK